MRAMPAVSSVHTELVVRQLDLDGEIARPAAKLLFGRADAHLRTGLLPRHSIQLRVDGAGVRSTENTAGDDTTAAPYTNWLEVQDLQRVTGERHSEQATSRRAATRRVHNRRMVGHEWPLRPEPNKAEPSCPADGRKKSTV